MNQPHLTKKDTLVMYYQTYKAPAPASSTWPPSRWAVAASTRTSPSRCWPQDSWVRENTYLSEWEWMDALHACADQARPFGCHGPILYFIIAPFFLPRPLQTAPPCPRPTTWGWRSSKRRSFTPGWWGPTTAGIFTGRVSFYFELCIYLTLCNYL